MKRTVTLLALLFITLCCFVLTLTSLVSATVLSAGIVTVRFNVTSDPLTRRQVDRRGLLDELTGPDVDDILHNIPSPDEIISKLPSPSSIQSKVESAIDTVETAVSNAGDGLRDGITNTFNDVVGKALPRNLTIGTRRYCVAFDAEVKCDDLPIEPSMLLPRGSADSLAPLLDTLLGQLSMFTKPFFVYLLIIESILTSFTLIGCLISIILDCKARGLSTFKTKSSGKRNLLFWFGWAILFPLASLAVFAGIVGFLNTMKSAVEIIASTSWISMELGPLRGFGTAGLSLCLAMMALGVASRMLS